MVADVADDERCGRAAFAAGEAAGVEDVGDLGVGVVVEESVDLGDGGGGVCRSCQAGLGVGRVRVWCWPPGRRTCAVMVSRGSGDGDVGEQQPGDAFAFAGWGGGVVPDGGQVGDQLADPGLLGVGELPGVLSWRALS